MTGTGGDIGSTLKSKIENDLVESKTDTQNRYGRNVAMAVGMVTDAASYDDTTAVSQHIVDAGATHLKGLLTKVNGQSIKLNAPAPAADPGTELRIVSMEGLRLYVQPVVDIHSISSPREMAGV